MTHYTYLCDPCRAKQELRVKLAGDGTTIGKRIRCLLFSFTVLEEEDTVSSVDGIHPIPIFRGSESYEVLSLALADVIKELQSYHSVELRWREFITR